MHLVGSGAENGEPKPVTMPGFGYVSTGDESPFAGEDFDSACSTPFVSAPSSPTRGGGAPSGYFFSAPASPVHYVLTSSTSYREKDKAAGDDFPDFEFSSRSGVSDSGGSESMSSADELFLNGKIRPMKLSSHLQRPQVLMPLMDLEEEESACGDADGEETFVMLRGRDMRMRNRSLHRKTRSVSPLRNSWREEHLEPIQVLNDDTLDEASEEKQRDPEQPTEEATISGSASSSRSSSSGSRNSKKWIFLKDLLYRSKSEGRASTKEKFWSSISLSPAKEKKASSLFSSASKSEEKCSNVTEKDKKQQQQRVGNIRNGVAKPTNGNVAKRRIPASAHELHYTANRAQAEEMKKKTYLPYRQGLFGCLGFSSKGYGALHGFTKTLNPVSSR